MAPRPRPGWEGRGAPSVGPKGGVQLAVESMISLRMTKRPSRLTGLLRGGGRHSRRAYADKDRRILDSSRRSGGWGPSGLSGRTPCSTPQLNRSVTTTRTRTRRTMPSGRRTGEFRSDADSLRRKGGLRRPVARSGGGGRVRHDVEMTTYQAWGTDPRFSSSPTQAHQRAGTDTQRAALAAASVEELRQPEGELECSRHDPRVGLRDPHLVLSYAALATVIGLAAVAVIAVSRAEPRDLPRVLKALPRIPARESPSS